MIAKANSNTEDETSSEMITTMTSIDNVTHIPIYRLDQTAV